MLSFFLDHYLSGEASVKHSFATTLIAIGLWGAVGIALGNVISTSLPISGIVTVVNIFFVVWGALAIYGASITSHAISQSYSHSMVKFGLRFLNFLILFVGIVIIILASSGQISWMTYLYQGVHH